jgi:hypothetical protein
MSGPKVIRVVTREELLARGEAQIAEIDAAVAEWMRIGRRNELLSESDISAAKNRRAHLATLLATDRFAELQKQTASEIDFLRADLQHRLEKAALAAAELRSTTRRQADAARVLLSRLKEKGILLEEALEDALEKSADGTIDHAAIAAGFAMLTPPSAGDDQQRLAQRLKGKDDRLTVDQWISSQAPADPSDAFDRLEARIFEIQAIAGLSKGQALTSQLRTAAAEPLGSKRNLLVDSLDIETQKVLSESRTRSRLEFSIRTACAALQGHDNSLADALLARVEQTATSDLAALLAEARAAFESAQKEFSRNARRDAVLRNLGALGYEIADGVATASVQKGQLVFRKASSPESGVEIVDSPGSDQIQVRPVLFESEDQTGDLPRDQDVETAWCSDLNDLSTMIRANGGEIRIERATAIGATPVKKLHRNVRTDRNASREGPTQHLKSRS